MYSKESYSNLSHIKLYSLILEGDNSVAKEFVSRCKHKGYSINPVIGKIEETLFQKVVKKDLTDIAIYLMEMGVDIHIPNKLGDTPLHEAAKNGSKVLVEELLKKGANPYIGNRNGMTPWMLARDGNHMMLASRLSPDFCLNYPNLSFSFNTTSTKKNKSQNEQLDLSKTDHPYAKNIRSTFFTSNKPGRLFLVEEVTIEIDPSYVFGVQQIR